MSTTENILSYSDDDFDPTTFKSVVQESQKSNAKEAAPVEIKPKPDSKGFYRRDSFDSDPENDDDQLSSDTDSEDDKTSKQLKKFYKSKMNNIA